MVLAKFMFIFLNERSFFTFFAPLTCLDHIPIVLLLFGPTRYEISEKIRALACPLLTTKIGDAVMFDAEAPFVRLVFCCLRIFDVV